MVIAVASGPAEDISDEAQAREAFGSLFARRRRLGTAEGLVGLEFVGVDARRGFAVRFVDVVQGGRGAVFDPDEVCASSSGREQREREWKRYTVEGYVFTFSQF